MVTQVFTAQNSRAASDGFSTFDANNFLLVRPDAYLVGNAMLEGSGIYLSSADTGTTRIVLQGLVAGEDYGIQKTLGLFGYVINLTVASSGVLMGKTAALNMAGRLTLKNEGLIDGDIRIGGGGLTNQSTITGSIVANALAGSTTVLNRGTIDGLNLGLANDTVDTLGGFIRTASLGEGADTYLGGAGADFVSSGGGSDRIELNGGDDSFILDVVSATARGFLDEVNGGGGVDAIRILSSLARAVFIDLGNGVATVTGGAQAEIASFENAVGGRGNDVLVGTVGVNVLNGGAGFDSLLGGSGADRLFGGADGDTLVGGAGRDMLTGGSPANVSSNAATRDVFRFDSVLDSANSTAARDVITDFTVGVDDIGLSVIDARANVAGNQAFVFIGTAAFTGVSGQLRYQKIGVDTFVFADVNGDRVADLSILLLGSKTLTVGDFIL
jgi:Ca2+-binding RTX toxin-like protein